MTPVLPVLHEVPAPAEHSGSVLHVHAAEGAAPVQLWWVPQMRPPVVGYTPQPFGTSSAQVTTVVPLRHDVSVPTVHALPGHEQA